MNDRSYVLRPISPAEADALRMQGGPVSIADEHPGYPCRQCLQDAAIGEELMLVSHDPFTTDSKYRSASPIFIHRSPCPPYVEEGGLPDQLTRRQLSVRAFDGDAMMIDAAVIDGGQLEPTIDRFFSDGHTDHIHVHNATRGCWAVAVGRSPTALSDA